METIRKGAALPTALGSRPGYGGGGKPGGGRWLGGESNDAKAGGLSEFGGGFTAHRCSCCKLSSSHGIHLYIWQCDKRSKGGLFFSWARGECAPREMEEKMVGAPTHSRRNPSPLRHPLSSVSFPCDAVSFLCSPSESRK